MSRWPGFPGNDPSVNTTEYALDSFKSMWLPLKRSFRRHGHQLFQPVRVPNAHRRHACTTTPWRFGRLMPTPVPWSRGGAMIG
jgi:hypothetical protein